NYSGTVNMAMDWDWSAGFDRENGLNFDVPQEQRKYTFWVNDDYDGSSDFGVTQDDFDKAGRVQNCDDDIINSTRDLEDFSRLQLKIDNKLRNRDDITFSFRFAPVDGTNPTLSINVFAGIDNSTGYLTVPARAKEQAIVGQKLEHVPDMGEGHYVLVPIYREKLLEVPRSGEVQILYKDIKHADEITPFIFEGKTKGKGNLILTAQKGGLTIPGAEVSLELTLVDVAGEYEKHVVTTVSEDTDIVKFTDETVDDDGTADEDAGHTDRVYEPESPDYILFVHGWNVPDWEKDRWAETVYKRLYWQGYRGHVGCFQWPTYEEDWSLLNVLSDKPIVTYNKSEYRAYQSGRALARRLEKLVADGKKVHIIAHSMGNVVVGQALKEMDPSNGKVQNYIATQAAISAHMYDNRVPEMSGFGQGPGKTSNLFGFFYGDEINYRPYLRSVPEKVEGNMYNYYNVEDFALNAWIANNWTKPWQPDLNLGFFVSSITTYSCKKENAYIDIYVPGNEAFYRHLTIYSPFLPLPFTSKTQLQLGENTFEIFAHCVVSRSAPLGAVADNVRGFEPGLDLRERFGFDGAHYSHSKQFRSNIAAERNYWRQVLRHFGLLPNEDDE
ncbi:MAG: alpha/beta fold hydrolase, partial [Holophagaceae bacterium]|nr:alpha/beta fold hydrolase [Holophagaceae bacterium]